MEKYALDYSENIEVNGDVQNIRVRAAEKGLPVVLFLHGGPGVCDRHQIMRNHSALAEKYTLVCWDQRGSGKSYTPAIRTQRLSVNTYVEDVEFMLEYLTGKFGVRKVAVVGHSWGSIIGTLAVSRRPDLVSVYIGEGQFVDGDSNEAESYRFCLEEAEKRGDKKALKALTGNAPVDGVYASHKAMMTQRDCLSRYGGAIYRGDDGLVKGLLMPLLKSPEYTLGDIAKYARGALYLTDVIWSDVVGQRLGKITRLDVPVAITQGRHDFNTPSALAKKWFDALDAPYKKWIWFEDSAHSPDQEEPDKWRAALDEILSETASAGK